MANKKINQLVSKTAILSTDIFGIGDATTGQLFKKTIAELQAAIGGAVISVNGLVGTVVLDTDDIQELATPTNKYFTDARARGAISLTVTGNSGASTYSSGTGVLNVPTYTLAGLGGITATFLSGTSGISYNSTTGVISYSGTVYTDASIRALFSGSTGITYNSSTGAISYSGTVYTDSSVRALISMTTTGTSGASTYNNTTGVINVPNYTLAGLGGISLTSLSGSGSVSYNNTTGVISSSITQYTDALARASVSLTTTGTSGASTYNSTTGVFNIPNYTTDLSGYLPLTGGTLTGALTGTSATFTSNVTIRPSAGYNAYFQTSGTAVRINYLNDALSTNVGAAFRATDFSFQDNSGGAILTLASTGAATFSSSVTATGLIVNTSSQFTTGGTAVNSIYASGPSTFGISNSDAIYLRRYGVGEYQFQTVASGANGGNLSLQSYGGNVGIGTTSPSDKLNIVVSANGNIARFDGPTSGIILQTNATTTDIISYGGSTPAYRALNFSTGASTNLSIATTGAATFSSSVTAVSFSINSNGTISSNGFWGTLHTKGAGSYSDWSIINSGGNGVMWNPTGTLNMSFGGNVGIGTSSPALPLEIVRSAGTACYVSTSVGSVSFLSGVDADGLPRLFTGGLTPISFWTNSSERMRITSAGNVLIGKTTSTGGILQVSNGTNMFNVDYDANGPYITAVNNANTVYKRFTYDASEHIFATSATERMRITSGGNILMGTTTDNGERLYVSGAIRATSTITANSDIRIKSNITKIENALEKVGQISGYTYNTTYDDKRHGGVIAQEIDKVFPEIVNTGNDGLMGVEYGNISALLIEAIKEQKKEIDELRTIIASK